MVHSLYLPPPTPLRPPARARLARAQRLAAFIVLSLALLLPIVPGDAVARAVKQRVKQAKRESGYASWYGPGFLHRRTASGEWFDPKEMAAAHRTLPMGTRVRVTNLQNGRRIVVRINDRGPYKKGRVIDVTPAVAKRLGFKSDGLTRVRIDVLKRPKHEQRYAEQEPRSKKRSASKKGNGRA
jgi:rare lipoprotein A